VPYHAREKARLPVFHADRTEVRDLNSPMRLVKDIGADICGRQR
jgi:hypothetical protein